MWSVLTYCLSTYPLKLEFDPLLHPFLWYQSKAKCFLYWASFSLHSSAHLGSFSCNVHLENSYNLLSPASMDLMMSPSLQTSLAPFLRVGHNLSIVLFTVLDRTLLNLFSLFALCVFKTWAPHEKGQPIGIFASLVARSILGKHRGSWRAVQWINEYLQLGDSVTSDAIHFVWCEGRNLSES